LNLQIVFSFTAVDKLQIVTRSFSYFFILFVIRLYFIDGWMARQDKLLIFIGSYSLSEGNGVGGCLFAYGDEALLSFYAGLTKYP